MDSEAFVVPFSLREKVPLKGADEGTAEAVKRFSSRQQWNFLTLAVFPGLTCLRRTLSPAPLPKGEGFEFSLISLT